MKWFSKTSKSARVVNTELDDHGGSDSEDEQSRTGSQFSSCTGENTGKIVEPPKPMLGGKENTAVVWSRMVVILVLISSASVAAGLTYLFTTKAEQETFEGDFAGFAKEIAVVTNKNAQAVLDAFNTTGTSVTAEIQSSNRSFPLFAISDFSRRMQSLEPLSKCGQVEFFSIIRDNQTLQEYEAWMPVTGAQVLEESQAFEGVPVNSSGIHGFVYQSVRQENRSLPRLILPTDEELPLVVKFQNYPTEEDGQFIGRDLTRFFKHDLALIESTGLPYLSDVSRRGDTPMSFFSSPIYTDTSDDKEVGAILMGRMQWSVFFEDLFPEGISTLHAVVKNDCDQNFTFAIEGPVPTLLGKDDYFHDPAMEYMEQVFPMEAFQRPDNGLGLCSYWLHVYPSQQLRDDYSEGTPALYTTFVVLIFAFTSAVFFVYDWLVGRRQETVMDSALKTDAIVTSLFPTQFRDRLLEQEAAAKPKDTWKKKGVSFAVEGDSSEEGDAFPELVSSKPVADLFPHTTIMMADVNGFTAWSSTREPSQTFTLLETIYGAFDAIASRRNVYKVETVGDCYVAVCGLPNPNPNHAVTMARFASDCAIKMNQLVHKLELVLGPGTANLGIRIGLHSGPTIAGVLRGDKARFQLFGDTVNTASRIETTGEPNRIHLSSSTAAELEKHGKGHWAVPRETQVKAKGLGEIKTFWLQSYRHGSTFGGGTVTDGSTRSHSTRTHEDKLAIVSKKKLKKAGEKKTERLVEWNCATLIPMLEQVMASRNEKARVANLQAAEAQTGTGLVIDEVKSIITLPAFEENLKQRTAVVPKAAKQQLKQFIGAVAESYLNNPFHNFDHASHVAMSVHKLMSRIVAPERADVTGKSKGSESNMDAAQLHDHTYGITSDPLTLFAIVLSALIHDVDHRGVPNGQLVKEDSALGNMYGTQSTAEQNSVDVAWGMLMDDKYKDLRACMYSNEDELMRLRQIMVNSVLATDIFDKKMGDLRKARWNAAFYEHADGTSRKDINRKATIVIEHIIQASDVSHTMQHWHVYQAWNEKLFHEMYLAFKDGRSAKHPKDGWYGGELWFFDNYVIPLAKKLESCGVFGVSSDECLIAAQTNREEWERKGKDVVAAMVAKYCTDDPTEEEEEVDLVVRNCVEC